MTAVETYIAVFGERDPQARARMIEACFAPDGRVVARSRTIRGHDGVAAMATQFFADPQNLRIRLLGIDVAGNTFRFRVVAERADGTTAEVFDAGELDADGRIKTILTFAGPLPDA